MSWEKSNVYDSFAVRLVAMLSALDSIYNSLETPIYTTESRDG